MAKHPAETVRLLNMIMVENKETDQVLVEKRVKKDWPGIIFPGGHIEPGEGFVAAAVREVKEETGLDISDLKLAGIAQFQDSDAEVSQYRRIIFFYKTTTFAGEIKSSREGEVFWMDKSELLNADLSDSMPEYYRVLTDDSISELTYIEDPEIADEFKILFY